MLFRSPQQEGQQGQQQDDQQQQGDQQGDEEGDQQNEEGNQEGEGEQQEAGGDPQDASEGGGEGDTQPLDQPVPPSGLTEQQAMQLLEAVGENAEPLQNAIQRSNFPSRPPPERDW